MLISTRWHALSLPPAAVVCVLCFCFLLSAALCCLAHTADLRQEEADDNQKQTRSTLQKTRPMRNMYVHHAATSWAWYHHATVASELRLRSFSINLLPFSVLLLWRQQHEGLHANKHKLSIGQRTWRSGSRHLTHLTRPAEPCARNHPSLTASS